MFLIGAGLVGTVYLARIVGRQASPEAGAVRDSALSEALPPEPRRSASSSGTPSTGAPATALVADQLDRRPVEPFETPLASSAADCSLEVELRHGVTGDPLPDAVVQWRWTRIRADDRTESLAHYRSDASGRITVRMSRCSALERCTAVLTAWKDDLVGRLRLREVECGTGDRVELLLEPAIAVTGCVRDARSGAPLAGVEVWVETFNDLDRCWSDSAGRYVLPRFPARGVGHVLGFRLPTHGRESVLLTVDADGLWMKTPRTGSELFPKVEGRDRWLPPPTVDVWLEPALALYGRVEDENGAPLAGAEVSAAGYYRMEEGVSFPDEASTTTGADGRFVLEGLRADIGHLLRIRREGHGSRTLGTSSDASGAFDCGTIVLRRELVLAGLVLDASGAPAEGLEVRLSSNEAPAELPARTERPAESTAPGRDAHLRVAHRERARVAQDGSYLFAGLEAGEYTLALLEAGRQLEERSVTLAREDADATHDLRLPAEETIVTGVVLHEGTPAANALVVLARGGRDARVVTADGNGRFRLVGLRAETEYELRAALVDENGKVRRESSAYRVDGRAGDLSIDL